jgi:predicted dehydrogenase
MSTQSSTRRGFLASAGATVYTLSETRAKAAFKDTVNLGFIGSGIRGTQLIDEFKEVQGARGIAVCDLYDGCLERAKEQLGDGIQTGKDYRAVLDNKDVDAVVIATPDHLHERIVLDAIDAGKHVYIEKPMTWAIEEGERIIAAINRTKLVLQVGSQGKTSTLTAKAREIVKSGELGKLSMVRLSEHRGNAEGAWVYPIPPDASERTIDWPRFIGKSPKKAFDPKIFFRWRCWWEYSGGVATDLFVHQFTTLHEVLDVKRPSAAVAMGGIFRWNDGRTVPDVMNALLEYPEGMLMDIYVNLAGTAGNQQRGVLIVGSEGSLQIGYGRLVHYPEPVYPEVQFYGSLQWPKRLRDEYIAKAPGPRKTEDRPSKQITVERGPSHNAWFIKSIVEGAPSRENAEDGHYAAAAAHLCNLAYRRKRRVEWNGKGKPKLS